MGLSNKWFNAEKTASAKEPSPSSPFMLVSQHNLFQLTDWGGKCAQGERIIERIYNVMQSMVIDMLSALFAVRHADMLN